MFSWMFDALMVVCLVAALHWLERSRFNLAAIALAVGTLIKYVPIFIVPALVLYMFKKGYSLQKIAQFSLVYLVVVVIPILPYWQGLTFVLGFQASRPGTGLNWQSVWYWLSSWFPTQHWNDYVFSFSAALGSASLFIGLLITYGLVYRYAQSWLAVMLTSLVGYLAFTKIVNEVYILPLLPLLLLAISRSDKPILKRGYKFYWSIGLAWALVSVPAYNFSLNWLADWHLVNFSTASLVNIAQPRTLIAPVLALVGTGFTLFCVFFLRPALTVAEIDSVPSVNSTNFTDTLAKGSPMMNFIRKNLDRYLAIIILTLAILFLGYNWVLTQQQLSRLETTNYEGLIRLDYQDSAIRFQRDAATERPALTTPAGFSLLAYNDQLSTINVNGSQTNLWDTAHGYTTDPTNQTLYHAMQGNGWTLTKEIKLGPGNQQATINYYYLNPAQDSQVSLILEHFHWYFTDSQITSTGFTGQFQEASREQLEQTQPIFTQKHYQLSLNKGGNLPGWVSYKVYSGEQNQWGFYSFFTRYDAQPVKANQRTLIGSEVISWNELP